MVKTFCPHRGVKKNVKPGFKLIELLHQFYFNGNFLVVRKRIMAEFIKPVHFAPPVNNAICGMTQRVRRSPGENGLAAFIFALSLAAVPAAQADPDEVITNFTQADSNIGERLFLETRFSKFFFANSGGDANFSLVTNDPVMSVLETGAGPVPGPFASPAMGAMNCRQCHLVDEEGGNQNLGNRTYADFAQRSPIPDIGDGRTHTPRNSPMLVEALASSQTPQFFDSSFLFNPTSNYNALLPGQPRLFLHRDEQFASAHDLIIATLTGRNYGWQPAEYATAVAHIAHIIRDDDGLGYLATQARNGQFSAGTPGLTSYSNIFSGFAGYQSDPRFINRFLISPQYRLDLTEPKVTDDQIIQTVAALIQVYLKSLTFSRDTNNEFNGSPYDVFLIKNGLPRQPDAGETSAQYARRLLDRINQLPQPQFVTDPADGEFDTHPQSFQFGTAKSQHPDWQLRHLPRAAGLQRLHFSQHRRHARGIRCGSRRRII